MRLLMQEVFDKHCVAEFSGSLKQCLNAEKNTMPARFDSSSWQRTFAKEMMPLDQYTDFCIRLDSTSILSSCFLSRGPDLFMIVGERCRPNRMPNCIVFPINERRQCHCIMVKTPVCSPRVSKMMIRFIESRLLRMTGVIRC